MAACVGRLSDTEHQAGEGFMRNRSAPNGFGKTAIKLNLRLPPSLHEQLKRDAADAGLSLNEIIVRTLNLLVVHTK